MRATRARRQAASHLAHLGVVGLLRTVDVVRRFLARVVEPHGITLQQFNVLRILRGAERAGEAQGLPTLELADRMLERAPGITRLLDRLEKKRLVERRRCPRDRRQVLCRIAPNGLTLLGRLERPMAQADADCLGMLDDRQLRSLLGLLGAVQAGHQEPSRPEPGRGRRAPSNQGER
ncbi:MAG TPA: MarR family transcriptional regulator [Vicinamibacteria bacterium]|nr:MarR family transcriptional regulator [Vicinamibacteria bacterium]